MSVSVGAGVVGTAGVVSAACSGTFVTESADAGDGAVSDAALEAASGDVAVPPDAGPACDLDGPFVTIENQADLNSPGSDVGLAITDRGLTAYVVRAETIGNTGGRSLYVSTRASLEAKWGSPTQIPGFSGKGLVFDNPTLPADGAALVLEATVSGQYLDLVRIPRGARGELDLAKATSIPGVNTPGGEFDPYLSRDGRTLYFAAERAGNVALYRASLDDTGAATRVELLAALSQNGTEHDPVISADGRTLYFTRSVPRDGGSDPDIFVARRASTSDEFANAVALPELRSDGLDYAVDISDDGCTLYFTSDRRSPSLGSDDIYVARKRPLR